MMDLNKNLKSGEPIIEIIREKSSSKISITRANPLNNLKSC